MDFADVGRRELVNTAGGKPYDPHVGERVTLAAGMQVGQQQRGAVAPEQPFPRERDFHGLTTAWRNSPSAPAWLPPVP